MIAGSGMGGSEHSSVKADDHVLPALQRNLRRLLLLQNWQRTVLSTVKMMVIVDAEADSHCVARNAIVPDEISFEEERPDVRHRNRSTRCEEAG
jgi:hypothetical protein